MKLEWAERGQVAGVGRTAGWLVEWVDKFAQVSQQCVYRNQVFCCVYVNSGRTNGHVLVCASAVPIMGQLSGHGCGATFAFPSIEHCQVVESVLLCLCLGGSLGCPPH